MRKKSEVFFEVNKLFDWWSAPHFMFGIVTALATLFFGWSVPLAFFGTLIVALLWELLEKHVRLSEAPGNAWVDVMLPLIAFVITGFMVDQTELNRDRYLGLLVITSLLYLFVNMLAWRARLAKDREFLG